MTTKRPHPLIPPMLIAALAVAAGIAALGAGGADPNAGKTPPAETGAATGHEAHSSPATSAAAKEAPVKGVQTTITGEVMDPACYLEAGPKSIGPGHFQCAVDCARSGQTLAIYDRANDRIYFIAGELPGKNPNDPVINFIHQKVDVSGVVYHRSGAYGIVINKVVPHPEKG